ncbi:MAG: hypothetical protein M3020_24400, partial [Myxococcota bacterium]|nr:hypothetical protein [Myxococcota bacterium]
VQIARGQGLIPARELGLPPGADHRRAFPPGKELNVVIVNRAGQKLTFSATEVARVEERSHYREFAGSPAAAPQASLGSLGDLLRGKLGGSIAEAAPPPSPTPPAPAEQKKNPAEQKKNPAGSASVELPPGVRRR